MQIISNLDDDAVRYLIKGLRYMSSSVRLSSVCLSSVTFVHPTQAIEIFGNLSTPFGTTLGDLGPWMTLNGVIALTAAQFHRIR